MRSLSVGACRCLTYCRSVLHLCPPPAESVRIVRRSLRVLKIVARVTNINRIALPQAALEFCPIHCPNGRLGQDLGFGGFAFALKLPELLNRNLAAVRAKLGQRSCFPNGP